MKRMKKVDGKLSPVTNINGNITYGNGSGTDDYNKLKNKPQIETVELEGNKTFEELGLIGMEADDILSILV